jgi:hypothetical protein
VQETTRAARLQQKPATRKLPTRGGRKNGEPEPADVMEIPEDSDEELSDVPSDV